MKATIDTKKKTILIAGSFQYSEFKDFMESLPELWRAFELTAPDEPAPYATPFNQPWIYTSPTTNPNPYEITSKIGGNSI